MRITCIFSAGIPIALRLSNSLGQRAIRNLEVVNMVHVVFHTV